jgi:hypothetical protein
MSHILHLGHQVTDLAGIEGRISTDAAGFDADLDVNCIKITTTETALVPFSASWGLPTGDIWLGFRYRSPANSGYLIGTDGTFLEFYDDTHAIVAQVRTERDDEKYHAMAMGDIDVDGGSSFIAASGQAYWVDVRVEVGADITIAFYVDGVLQSSATAPNTAGKGKPVKCIWKNYGLHDYYTSSTWYYAHIAVLDGVSTIGRRFARRTPDLVATHDAFSGGVDAVKDGDIATRAASDIAGQRMSFTLAGPTGPAGASAIAGVHVKQLAQLGTAGPTGVAGFLRIGGVDYDAPPGTPSVDMPSPVYSTWDVNPADSTPWTTAALPTEAGIVSS